MNEIVMGENEERAFQQALEYQRLFLGVAPSFELAFTPDRFSLSVELFLMENGFGRIGGGVLGAFVGLCLKNRASGFEVWPT